jgi:peptidoglycan-N-acetylglucosamine deacetylase
MDEQVQHFRKYSLVLTALIFALNIITAQSYETDQTPVKSEFKWPEGKKMALSLTWDDSRNTQVDKGIPLLNKYGIKGTFYISSYRMVDRIDSWKEAVKMGHEIGNHSVTHPCSQNAFWNRRKPLEEYTLDMMRLELDSANRYIKETFGVQAVSFAYPHGLSFVGRGVNTESYVPVVASMFETGRGWLGEYPNSPIFCDMSQLTGMEMDGKSFEQILKLIELASERGLWLILAGHETDDKDAAWTTYLKTLEEICIYAKDPANGIWIDNVRNIASYIKEMRGDIPLAEK